MQTVTFTDEQVEFLEQLTTEMQTQNIRMTQYPLFYVYQRERRYFETGTYGYDYEERSFSADHGEPKEELCSDCYNLYNANADLPEYTDCDCNVVYVKEEDVPAIDVGPFFSEKAAQNHIDKNYYHYYKPFIYVNSAWRNYELQEVLQLLFTLVGKEIPSQYK